MKNKIPTSSRKPLNYRGEICLNCENLLEKSDRYCSYCGQLNSTKKLTLGNFFSEFIISVINYDSRFRTTIKDLLFKPGTITHRYVSGKRVTYANPFRFFLSVSIIYFLLSSFLNFIKPQETASNEFNYGDLISGKNSKEFNTVLDSIAYYSNAVNDTVRKRSAKTPQILIKEKDLENLGFFKRNTTKLEVFQQFSSRTLIKNPQVALDSLNFEPTRLNLWMYERTNTYNRIKEEPLEFLSYLSSKIPVFLFFFSPFFALFFFLIYFKRFSFKSAKQGLCNIDSRLFQKILSIPFIGQAVLNSSAFVSMLFVVKREHTYIKHLIFIFHIFTFIFLGLVLLLIPEFLIGTSSLSGIFFFIVCPFYFYKALRNFYKEGRGRTLLKFLFLNSVFLILTISTGILFVFFTAAIY